MDKIKLIDKGLDMVEIKDYIIEKGTINDIDELENLYNDLNDYLGSGINYPGWKKGIYPIRENAVKGVIDKNLFVLKVNNEIAGSIILNNEQEDAYNRVDWGIEADSKEIIVIHTFVVNPKYMRKGIGKKLIDFTKTYSIEKEMKAVRLDVSIHNTPGILLYEKCGYKCMGIVDLGLNIPGLVWFKLYEIVL